MFDCEIYLCLLFTIIEWFSRLFECQGQRFKCHRQGPKRICHKGAKTLKPRFICIVNDVLVKN